MTRTRAEPVMLTRRALPFAHYTKGQTAEGIRSLFQCRTFRQLSQIPFAAPKQPHSCRHSESDGQWSRKLPGSDGKPHDERCTSLRIAVVMNAIRHSRAPVPCQPDTVVTPTPNRQRRDVAELLVLGLPLSLLLGGCGSGDHGSNGRLAASTGEIPNADEGRMNGSKDAADIDRHDAAHSAHADSNVSGPRNTGNGPQEQPERDEVKDFRQTLYTPTQITRLGSHYFIVDCWHHRIIYSERLDTPLNAWRTLDEDIAGPHSIASDGTLYVAEDTGRHGLKVYREVAAHVFRQVQYLPGVGRRPHRVLHDAARGVFLVVGSEDQSLHMFSVRDGLLEPVFSTIVPELNGQYCRSITQRGDVLYLVGSNDIVAYRFDGMRLAYAGRRWALPEICRGSNDIFFLNEPFGHNNAQAPASASTTTSAPDTARASSLTDKTPGIDPLAGGPGILTSTPGKAFVFASLDDLAAGRMQDISSAFRGTPYYVSQFDGRLWIPDNTEYSAIRHYPLPFSASSLRSGTTLLDAGPARQISLDRKLSLPT